MFSDLDIGDADYDVHNALKFETAGSNFSACNCGETLMQIKSYNL